jgi:hypothetical protein
VQILSKAGGRISLSPLDPQPEPENLLALKADLTARWPMTSLLDMLKETDLRVHFSMVYINTLMIQRVLSESLWSGRLTPEDLRALTPLIYGHVNPYGIFQLDMNTRLPIDPTEALAA